MSKFPATIFARWETDGEDEFLITGDSIQEVSNEIGQSVKVARYALVGEGVVHNKPYYVEGAELTASLGEDDEIS